MKNFRLGLLFFVALGLSGCAYIHTETPGLVQSLTEYSLTSKDFKVLKPVSVTGETTLWFGMVLTGGKGYQALLAEARELGGDAIMNYSFDIEQESILFFIYTKVKWKATGLAIKYADHVYQK